MTDRELMQQALNLLDDINQCSLPPTGIPLPAEIDHVMEALRARLAQPDLITPADVEQLARIEKLIDKIDPYEAQPEPEPVAWVAYENGEKHGIDFYEDEIAKLPVGTMLYTAPPQREWQGLTENEKELLWDEAVNGKEHFCSQYGDFADAIEAKLKEKNGF